MDKIIKQLIQDVERDIEIFQRPSIGASIKLLNIVKDLDQFEQHIKEECAKENKRLIHWLSNLANKIMKYDDFKGLRGYPITHFLEKYGNKE